MNDLKLYASGQALTVVQMLTCAVGMEFAVEKCTLVHLKSGRCGEKE